MSQASKQPRLQFVQPKQFLLVFLAISLFYRLLTLNIQEYTRAFPLSLTQLSPSPFPLILASATALEKAAFKPQQRVRNSIVNTENDRLILGNFTPIIHPGIMMTLKQNFGITISFTLPIPDSAVISCSTKTCHIRFH